MKTKISRNRRSHLPIPLEVCVVYMTCDFATNYRKTHFALMQQHEMEEVSLAPQAGMGRGFIGIVWRAAAVAP